MADYQPTSADSGVYPFEDRIMDSNYQLSEPTSRPINLAVVGPAAALGVGLIGAVSYFLARRRSETLAEKVTRMLEERRDAAVDLADSVYSDVSHFATHEGRDMADDAAKKGRTLFKLGKKKAQAAYEEGRDLAEDVYGDVRHFATHEGRDFAEDAAKKGRKFFKLGKRKAAQAYENVAADFEDFADEAPKKARQIAKASGKVAAKTAKTAKRSAGKLHERYPLLTGLLLAALLQQGERLLEQRQQSQAKPTSKRSTRKATA
jgi:hypothetical protein